MLCLTDLCGWHVGCIHEVRSGGCEATPPLLGTHGQQGGNDGVLLGKLLRCCVIEGHRNCHASVG